ncbi:MAG: hypothetical protein RIT07_1832, partial [Bacteroidota bacterium]
YVLTGSADATARIWDASSGQLLLTLSGHAGRVKSASFSPDGKMIVTVNKYKTHLWSVETGKLLHEFSGSDGDPKFSPNGKIIVKVSDYKAEIWNTETGKLLDTISDESNGIVNASFSPNGQMIVTNSYDKTAVWDLATGKLLHSLSPSIGATVFSPNGKIIVTLSDDTALWDFKNHQINTEHARVWDTETGKLLHKLSGPRRFDEYGPVSYTHLPNGRTIVTACDDTSHIWDAETGILLYTVSGGSGINSFSSDGKMIVTVTKNKAHLWSVKTGILLHTLSGHSSWITEAIFSPDSRRILTVGYEIAYIWDATTGQLLDSLSGHSESIETATFSTNGNKIVTASNEGTVYIWELSSGKMLQMLKGHTDFVNTATFSPDDGRIVTASYDATARIWDALNGKLLYVLAGHTGCVNNATFSPDGKRLFTVSNDYTARIWDALNGELLHVLAGHTGQVNCATFSPDSRKLVTASTDKTARIWDVLTGKLLDTLNGHSESIKTISFSPDGKRIVTASHDGTVRIWDCNLGILLQILPCHKPNILARYVMAQYNPAGDVILSVTGDKCLRLWDSQKASLMQTLNENVWVVSSAVFNPINNTIASICAKDTARIWDVVSGNLLQTMVGHNGWLHTIQFSPNGKNIITTGGDHKTILWDAATGKSLYTRLQLTGNDWLVYDEDYHFDGTEGAINYLYFVCGLEVVELAQLKDSLWVPGLAEKIMKGEEILINDKPAPKLKNLNICEFTPVIETPMQDGKKLRYRIVPRRGGLGNTEVIINGNPTYSYAPNQLERKIEDGKEVFYLNLNTDTLQDYLAASTGAANPLQVKAAVKGSGIYGRGQLFELFKSTGTGERPKFYGVFVGVNDYGNPQGANNANRYRDLTFAKKDAGDMADAVEACARNLFDKDSCFIYRLNGTANTAPTKDNLQRVLGEIGKKARALDVLYIFFAGHGDLMETDGSKQIRFLLQNAEKRNLKSGSFGTEDLTDWCHPRKIKAQKRVFVFDACHSGQFMNETYAAVQGRGDDEGKRIRQLDKLKDQNGMMILAASAENESAYEDETLNQGVLTYHLLQAMKTQSKDTTLTVRTWFDETIELVKDYSRQNGQQQEPRSFGDGYFFIGNVNKAVRDSIRITKPKIRIGYCTFSAVDDEIEQRYPMLEKKVNDYFSSVSRSGQLVYSNRNEGVCKVIGNYSLAGSKLKVRYSVVQKEKKLGNAVELVIKKGATEGEIAKKIAESIEKVILERCKTD